MKLTTPVNITPGSIEICHKTPLTLMGSCFAANIGEKLDYHKFNTCINPFGIIYNPVSLFKSLDNVVSKKEYAESDLIEFEEKWLSLDHHGSFSNLSKTETLKRINRSIQLAHNHLTKNGTLVITLGSAWVYEYGDFGVVANCHKIPAKKFNKRLLSVKEIITKCEQMLKNLGTFNPSLNIIFTISPVRHVKDGLHQNNLSKSTLHLAVHRLVNQHENCHYFPAFEIVMDELRDYRFFTDDLVHPTNLATNYVWEKFALTYFSEQTILLNQEIASIQQALAHRPLEEKSSAHQQFLENTKKKISDLEKNHPYLCF